MLLKLRPWRTEEEEETEELVNQVLDEIGIDINQEVSYFGVLSSHKS